MSDRAAVSRALTRRHFLQLAGSAAAISAVPVVLSRSRAGAAATRDILAGPDYPIGFWWPPPPEETTVARYAEIAEAGFTFVTGGNGVNNMPLNATMLDAAAANGLKALPTDDRIGGLTSTPPEQWHDVVSATLAEYEPYEAFSGFSIVDEPNASRFPALGDEVALLRELHPDIFPFINLLPTYATVDQLGAPTYQDYLQHSSTPLTRASSPSTITRCWARPEFAPTTSRTGRWSDRPRWLRTYRPGCSSWRWITSATGGRHRKNCCGR